MAEELKASGHVEPRYHEAITILFSDFKEFTLLTETLEPARLLAQLDQNSGGSTDCQGEPARDHQDDRRCLYVCGRFARTNRTHAIDACLASLQMQAFIRNANRQREKLRLPSWELRIGVNSGSVIAGVVGKRRFTYDIWGNSVNVAQRLEEACEPGRVNVSASTLHHVARRFQTEPRGRWRSSISAQSTCISSTASGRTSPPMPRVACPTTASGTPGGLG